MSHLSGERRTKDRPETKSGIEGNRPGDTEVHLRRLSSLSCSSFRPRCSIPARRMMAFLGITTARAPSRQSFAIVGRSPSPAIRPAKAFARRENGATTREPNPSSIVPLSPARAGSTTSRLAQARCRTTSRSPLALATSAVRPSSPLLVVACLVWASRLNWHGAVEGGCPTARVQSDWADPGAFRSMSARTGRPTCGAGARRSRGRGDQDEEQRSC
jgi:hypothetical protein